VPVVSSMAVTGGNMTFDWSAFPNVSYQIQSSTNLATSGWTAVGGPILATNAVMHVSLPMSSAPMQFYRVALLPP
jgi:hypothetical protein